MRRYRDLSEADKTMRVARVVIAVGVLLLVGLVAYGAFVIGGAFA